MARVLGIKIEPAGLTPLTVIVLQTRERRRIQIVSEIEAHRADRSLVSHPHADGVRNVVVVALARGGLMQAELRVFLAPAQQVVEQVMSIGKYVSGIVEDGKADVVLEERQGRRRQCGVRCCSLTTPCHPRESRFWGRGARPDSIRIRDVNFRPRRKSARPAEDTTAARAEARCTPLLAGA